MIRRASQRSSAFHHKIKSLRSSHHTACFSSHKKQQKIGSSTRNSMEKPSRSKSSIFAFLPKTARVSFSNPPYSPGAEKRIHHKGFSGPIISIIPAEARTKQRNGNFDSQEPTSPKVSCIGQIKHKQKICKAKCKTPPPKLKAEKKTASAAANKKTDKKQSFKIGKFLRGRGAAKRDGKLDADAPALAAPASMPVRAPPLGQMRRFASGRDTLSDFDWKDFAGRAAARRRGYYSDDDRNLSDEEEFFEEDIDHDDGFGVPHSAPLPMTGGPPRKEINLWMRRTTAPPRPLALNCTAKK
ncbi:hypothetical protein ACLOJK_002269 [Asimina triloba]